VLRPPGHGLFVLMLTSAHPSIRGSVDPWIRGSSSPRPPMSRNR